MSDSFNFGANADALISDPSYGALAQGSLPSNFSTSDYWPAYAGGTDTTGVGPGWRDAIKGLPAALKAAQGASKEDPALPAPSSGVGGGAQSAGASRGSAAALNALVQMLMQNQALYQGGMASGQPVQQKRQIGLLGF